MRRWWIGFGFVGLGLTIAACGSNRSAVVSLMIFGEPEEVAAYRELVDEYRAAGGDRVDLIVAADRSDLLTRVSTSIATGSPPALFLVNHRFYGQFADSDALQPMQSYLDESDGLRADAFYDVALDAFRWEGSQMCLPQNVASLVVYYNADLFAAAGLLPPPDDWTWDEMVTAAEQLTVDADGDGVDEQHGLGLEPGVIRLAPFVWSSGGELFDDPDDPTRFTLDTAPAIRAVQRFIELYSPRGVTPSDAEIESEDVVARFMNGRLAMLLSSRRVVPELRTIESFEWDVAPIPAEQEPANVLHSDAFCMTAASEHPDAAWKFVEFALGADGQTVLAATGRTVPSLRSVAESDAFLDPSEPPFRSDVFIDAIPVLRRLPSIEAWPEIEDIADALIEEAMFDPAGPPEAAELITALQTETAAAFARGRP